MMLLHLSALILRQTQTQWQPVCGIDNEVQTGAEVDARTLYLNYPPVPMVMCSFAL